MQNMIKSPTRWDKIDRQEQADRRLKGMGQPVDKWAENAGAYINRPHVEQEYVVNDLKKRITDARKINDLDDESLLQQINRASLPMYANSNAQFAIRDMNHQSSANGDMVLDRYLNQYNFGSTKNSIDNTEQHQEEYTYEHKSILANIVSTVKRFLGLQPKESFSTMNYNKPDVESEFDYYPELPINMQSPSDIERTVNNTVYAVRDGSVMTVMPDSLETYGSTFVSPVSRMMCVYDKGEMVIIQKFDSDRILGSDLRPIKDDYIVTVLPHQYTDKFRDRIHNSEGRKFVEMSTADFLALSQFITSNPDVQTRVKPEKIQALIRGNDIDERMLDEFSGDNILISDEAITKYFETNDREQNIIYDIQPDFDESEYDNEGYILDEEDDFDPEGDM